MKSDILCYNKLFIGEHYEINQDIIYEIERLYSEYEQEMHSAQSKGWLVENTVKTYLLHSGNFVKWCNGHFTPGVKNARETM